MVQDCPKCGLVNAPEAQRCDCGYDFASRQLKGSYLKADGPLTRDPRATDVWRIEYQLTPWYRRSGLVTSTILMGLVIPPLLWVACGICLSGEVYYNRPRKDGSLARWSQGNRVAAVIILVLQALGIAYKLGLFTL